MNTETKQFRTREATAVDFDSNTQYQGAMSGGLWPGRIAAEVFGPKISFSLLFAYCFRRFGFPNAGCDSYKEIATYRLITPMPGVYLTISIAPGSSPDLLFGYYISTEIYQQIVDETDAIVSKFRADFLAWRLKTGSLLPRDKGESEDFNRNEYDHLLSKYCADGGKNYSDVPNGPVTQEVNEAFRTTIEDLKTPVRVRDSLISAASESCDFPSTYSEDEDDDGDGECEGIAQTHFSAGSYVPNEIMSNTHDYFDMIEQLTILGNDNISAGVSKFLERSNAPSVVIQS